MKEINLTVNGVTANLRIHPATTLAGMRRGQIAAGAKDAQDPLFWYAARFMYPDCLACTDGEIDGKAVNQLTLDEFLALPDQITEAWLDTVYIVNPHWQPKLPDESTQEKKVSMPSGG